MGAANAQNETTDLIWLTWALLVIGFALTYVSSISVIIIISWFVQLVTLALSIALIRDQSYSAKINGKIILIIWSVIQSIAFCIGFNSGFTATLQHSLIQLFHD